MGRGLHIPDTREHRDQVDQGNSPSLPTDRRTPPPSIALGRKPVLTPGLWGGCCQRELASNNSPKRGSQLCIGGEHALRCTRTTSVPARRLSVTISGSGDFGIKIPKISFSYQGSAPATQRLSILTPTPARFLTLPPANSDQSLPQRPDCSLKESKVPREKHPSR